jgi:hypothetical protein
MRTPHRLQVGTSYEDAISLLNDNFEKSIQDISDLGASSTTTTQFNTNSVAAGATYNKTISILQAGSSPAADSIILTERANGLRGAMPAIDIYVDATGSDYLYPTGSSLTTGQQAVIANAHINITEQGSGIASLVFSLRNCDSSAHSYIVSLKLVYLPETSNG